MQGFTTTFCTGVIHISILSVLDFKVSCPDFSSDSPEIQPKFVKGSKRYGRRSTPEFIEHHSDFPDVMNADAAQHEDLRDSDDSAVPRKREVRDILSVSGPTDCQAPPYYLLITSCPRWRPSASRYS